MRTLDADPQARMATMAGGGLVNREVVDRRRGTTDTSLGRGGMGLAAPPFIHSVHATPERMQS